MKLKDIKNSAARLIQNALQLLAVTCIYGYDTRKKHQQLRYRMDMIRQKVQHTINDRYHKMNPNWPKLCRFDLNHLNSEFEDCIVQISYLKKDLHSLNDHPNRQQQRWRESFTLDLNIIWEVAADHQWAIQNEINNIVRSLSNDYEGSLSAYSAASAYASNDSIWWAASVSGSRDFVSNSDQDSDDLCDGQYENDLCDGQYENDFLEFLNAFQIDC